MRTSLLGLALLGTATAIQPALADEALAKIKTIVVIYAENRSFDNLYGLFPGANGIANATAEQKTQLDHDGKPLPLPDDLGDRRQARSALSRGMPNGPFRIDAPPIDMPLDADRAEPDPRLLPEPASRSTAAATTCSPRCRMSAAGRWATSTARSCKLWQWAQEYTLADNFFMGAFGGSYLNHQWLVCACTPRYPDAPEAMRAQLDAGRQAAPSARLARRPMTARCRSSAADGGQVTPDGYSVNTTQPPYQPSGIAARSGRRSRPRRSDGRQAWTAAAAADAKTIGDTLSAKGVELGLVRRRLERRARRRHAAARRRSARSSTTATTARRISSRITSRSTTTRASRPARADRAAHLKDGDDLLRDIDAGHAAAGRVLQAGRHGSTSTRRYTDLVSGDVHIDELLERLRKSPQWKRHGGDRHL